MVHSLQRADRALRHGQKPIHVGDHTALHYKSLNCTGPPVCLATAATAVRIESRCPPEVVCQGNSEVAIATVQLQHVACAASRHTPSPTQHFLADTCHMPCQSG